MYVWFIMTWEGCFRSFDKDTRTLTLSLSLGKADWFDFIVICCSLPYYALHCTIPTHTHTHAHDRLLLFPFNFDLSVSVFSSLFFSTVLLLVSSSFIWIFYMVSFFGVTFEESDRERERSKARSLVVSVCLL